MVRDQDRPAGGGEKNIRDSLRRQLQDQNGFTLQVERPESWLGKKIPGHTFIAEKAGTWHRLTYFIVPKPRNTGASIVYFECWAPKSAVGDQLEKEFDAFIRGVQFST